MIAAATMLWSIISIIVEGFTLISIIIIVSLGCSFLIIRIPNLKFCQIFVFILQVTACAFIPLNKNQTDTSPHWRIYLNGAASMLWLFMGYQAFLFELISIIVSVVVPILTLNVQNEYIAVCVLFIFLLIVQRYLHNLGQRRLFLALQSLQQWEEAIEKTVPCFFMIQRFEFVTHQMYLQNSNRNFTRFLEGQSKQKGKLKGENISNNKSYIEFLKNCEIETGIMVMPQSPAANNQYAVGSPNYQQNKNKSQSGDFGSYSYRKRSANFLNSCSNLGQHILGNGNQTFSGSLQVPHHQMKLFDFLLAKHDKLLSDNSRKEEKKPFSWHSVTQSILKKSRWILTGSSTNEDPQGKKNSHPVLGEESNIAREEMLKVSYKGNNTNGAPMNMLLRVKIISLSSSEPLLAIQMQDITSTEEEKKGKQVEQENTLVILQALQQAKKNLDFLKSNLLTIKSNLSLRQAIFFPLNIIRSTCILDKTKLQYNPFYLSSLLKDVQGVCGNNLIAICIKNNSQADLGDSILEEAIRLKSIKEQVISGEQQGTLQNINLSTSNLNNDTRESQENPYYMEDPNDFNEESDQQDYSNNNFLKQFPYRSQYVFLGQENSIRLPIKHLSLSVEQQEIQKNLMQYPQQQSQQVLMSIPSLSKVQDTQGGSETIGQNNASQTQLDAIQEDKQAEKKQNLMINIPRSNQLPQGSISKANLPKRTNIIPRSEKRKQFTKSISNGNLKDYQQQTKVKKSTSSHSLVNNQQNQQTNEKKYKSYEDKLPQNNFSEKNNALPQSKKPGQIGTMKHYQSESKRTSYSDLTIHFHETPLPPPTLPYFQDIESTKIENRKNNLKSPEKFKIPMKLPSKTLIKEDQQKLLKPDYFTNDNATSEADSFVHFSSLGIELQTNANGSLKFKKEFLPSSNVQKTETSKWSQDSRQLQTLNKVRKESHGYGLNTRNEIGCIYDDSEISDTELAQSGITPKVGGLVNSGKQNVASNQGDCLVFSNQQLIFQVLTSIITSFGDRKVQLLVEQVHNRLYSSLKFVFKSKEVPQQTYNTLNEDQATVITTQSPPKQHMFEFGFQNASDLQQQQQQQQLPQTSVNIPQLFTYPITNNSLPRRNTSQNSSEYPHSQQQTQYQQKMMMTNLANDNRPYPKLKFSESQQQQTFCTSSADLCNKKQLSSDQQQNSQGINEQEHKETQEIQSKNQRIQDEHIKSLYGLNYSNNKQLMNKIWKNLKEISSILGPGTIDCQQNSLSVEFFLDMNIVKKDSQQQSSTFAQAQYQSNLPQSHNLKPSRVSIFSQINSSHNFHHLAGAQTPLTSNKNNNPSFTIIPAQQSPLMAKHHYFKQDSGLGAQSSVGGVAGSAKNISNHFFPSSFNLQASRMSSNEQGNSKNYKEETNFQESSSKYDQSKQNQLIPEEEERHIPVVQQMGSTNSDYFQSVQSCQDEGSKSVQSVKHFSNQIGQFN